MILKPFYRVGLNALAKKWKTMNATHGDNGVLVAIATQHTLVDSTLVPSTRQALIRLQLRGLVAFDSASRLWKITGDGQLEVSLFHRGISE